MLRKILAVLLSIVMFVGGIPITASTKTEHAFTEDTTIIKTPDKVVAQKNVGDCIVQYEYLKKSEESFLSIAGECYKLEVVTTNNAVLVSISDEVKDVYSTKVVAQAVGTATIALGLFTATVVYAAKDIIVAGLTAAIELGNKSIEVAADSIARTINNVRTKRINASNVTTQTKAERKVALSAITKIQKAKRDYTNYYFAARLVNGTVYISKQISYSQAVIRLRSGLDVFASSSFAAQKVAKAASFRRSATLHGSHQSGDGYYPHFHPVGVMWKSNTYHQPHCWYPQ